MNLSKLTLARFNVVAALVSSVLLSAGCANMQTSTSNDVPVGAEATITGRVHGGNQPVSNATVLLYAVGQTGAGQGAVLYASAVTSNDGTGSFRFNQSPTTTTSLTPATPTTPNYACPAGTDPSTNRPIADPLMYLFSAGGNTTGTGTSTQNTAAAFLAPLGYCSQINNSTFVDISEVTTVATVAAAAQFINPNNDQIGADGIGVAYAAIGNAFKMVPNLVSAANGLATPTSTITGTASGVGVSGVSMTVTAPAAQLNAIANIISACVNQTTSTSSTACNTLFTNAVPPASSSTQSQPGLTYNAANDTVKAALYMFLNPTSGGAAARTNLFNLQAAAGAPYNPSLMGAPNNWLLAMTYTTNSTCGSASSSFFAHPYDLNADINGNLWIANKAGGNAAIVEIAPNGLPETCVSTGGSSLGGGVVDTGGSNANYTIWYTDNQGGKVYGYNPASNTTRTFTAPGAMAITADGTGNVFFSTLVGSTGSVYEIINAVDQSNTSNPVLLSSAVGPNPARMFPDSANDIWVTSGSTFVTELTLTATGGTGHNYVAIPYNVTGPTYGIVVGPNNRVYITSQDSNSTVTVLAPPSSGTGNFTVLYTTSAANTGGLNLPTSISLDGAQNSWIGNNTAESSGTYALTELASNVTALSPSGTNGGFQNSAISAARTTVVDSVGNVWVLSDNNANSLTVFLGAAVPIYAPYAQGIVDGRFQSQP